MLQLLQRPPFDAGPRRLAVMLSAWDKANGEGLPPLSYLEAKLPLLAQYLRRNADKWRVNVYGVSAQGGEYDAIGIGTAGHPEAETLRQLDLPSKRIRLVGAGSETHDLTEPLAWLMA
jgi:hypothetical protein